MNDGITIEQRVANIEQTIGDIAFVLYKLRQALAAIPQPQPNCPPYCPHSYSGSNPETLPIEERVEDIRKCIGDIGVVLGSLTQALEAMAVAPPDCPPYCGHDGRQWGQ